MNQDDITYYKIVKTLGNLTTTLIEEKEVPLQKFGMKAIHTKESFEYGTHNYYLIELFHNGLFEDISSDQVTFSYIITNYTRWYSSNWEWHNWFTIKFKKGTNIEEIQFDCDATGDLANTLCYIIYALVLIKEINDINKVKTIYSFLFCAHVGCGTLGQRIDIYKEAKVISTNIIDKYPFMDEVIKKGLEQRLSKIKNELLQNAIIENNL